jgi:hypothetical protein
MKLIKQIILIIFISQANSFLAQKELENYFISQEKDFITAYEQKDTTEYLKLLDAFNDQFNNLNEKDKLRFLNYQINAYYNLSCIYSLLNVKKKSIDYLAISIDKGFSNLNQLQNDKDLDSLRNESAYFVLENKLKMICDFSFILKHDNFYNNNDRNVNELFYYQSSQNKNLSKLKNMYQLDSIAGNGSEIERLQNVLFWVHSRVKHDGNINNPKIKNAINFIEKCDKNSKGLNCRGMAILLNECYLSLGYPSRIVCCFPKDSLKKDTDCHVLTTVFSKELNKWIWLDPTMNSLIYDSNGSILSIEEVRKALINNDSLYLNQEANWNGNSIDKNQYLYQYMTKNLYYLESPIYSQFNYESRKLFKKYRYVKLSPENYISNRQRIQVSKSVMFTKNISLITTNSNYFWTSPY